jgi:hypothetical protein
MGRVEAILAVALAVSMAGCVLKGKPKVAAAPPQPQPAIQPKPAPPPEALSIPQTQVQLPPPQPVNPEALAVPPPPEPVEPAPAPKPVRRTAAGSPPATKPEVVGPVAPPAAEPERAPIQEIVPADERRRYQESAEASKREIRQLVEHARAHRLTAEQKKIVTRIQTFVTQSDDAEKRGDMRQADALAERGLVLAKGLAGDQ